jgi:hypothetical protein
MAYQEEELLTEIIVVESTKAPFGTAKTGALNASNGKQFRAPPNMLGMLYPGSTYQVTYFVNNFNGKTYNMVKTIKQVGDEGNAPAPNPRVHPQATSHATQAPSHAPANDTQKSIFVCGGLNQGIASQQVNVMDAQSIVMATRALMNAYDNSLGAKPGAQSMAPKATARGDMDDEIPF